MPCRGPEPDLGAELQDMQFQRDKVTRLLCALCASMEVAAQELEDWPNGVLEWWQEHQRLDFQRRKQELEVQQRREQEDERLKQEDEKKERQLLAHLQEKYS